MDYDSQISVSILECINFLYIIVVKFLWALRMRSRFGG